MIKNNVLNKVKIGCFTLLLSGMVNADVTTNSVSSYKNTPTPLQAIVFHGQHSHVDGYAKDSAMTVVIQPSVLAGEPSDSVEGPEGRLMMTWDRNAAGERNATSQESAAVSREGQTLIVRGGYYWLKGDLNGNKYSGQYFNPKNELCGSFTILLPKE
jgi:hypothetical protein